MNIQENQGLKFNGTHADDIKNTYKTTETSQNISKDSLKVNAEIMKYLYVHISSPECRTKS
jgi:hypothetical protein